MRVLLFLPVGAMLVTATACPRVSQVAPAPKPLENSTQNNMAAKAQLQARPAIRLWNHMHRVSAT
jgi:hypothetical protein